MKTLAIGVLKGYKRQNDSITADNSGKSQTGYKAENGGGSGIFSYLVYGVVPLVVFGVAWYFQKFKSSSN